MKAFYLLLALVGCNACGAEPEINPELKVIMEHYLRFAPNEGKLDLVDSIEFGELSNSERGSCDHTARTVVGQKYDERRTITIDPRGYTPVAVVLFHELGHCLHDLPHAPQGFNIMSPTPVGGADYWTPEQMDTAIQAMFLGLHI